MLNKPTVNSALKGFRKTIDKLRLVAIRETEEADAKTAQINELRTQVAGHDAEAHRAVNIADKLAALLED